MRLRQIKLAGFKSFADPALIELEHPVVGIVGPNGCGKSNIIDAVRWVLGEARVSELRGSSSMRELIFAGSTTRHALGRASVELILTNDDGRLKGAWSEFGEISVKRVVTAEGQSAYYINHQQVRRRDVQEIFLGTGLGPRSYAIISQGMISNFIRAKPEEMRVYLEEAAGVSLYRERRRETESLLSQTRGNLERVRDMQAVKEEEAARLEGEAQLAGKWRALTDERNAAESLWYWIQYEDVKRTLDGIAADIARRVRRVDAGLFRREPHDTKERTNGDDMSLIADRTPRLIVDVPVQEILRKLGNVQPLHVVLVRKAHAAPAPIGRPALVDSDRQRIARLRAFDVDRPDQAVPRVPLRILPFKEAARARLGNRRLSEVPVAI